MKRVLPILIALVVSFIVGFVVAHCVFVEEPVDALEQESGMKILNSTIAKGSYGNIEFRWHLEDNKIVLDTNGYLTAVLRQRLQDLGYHSAIIKISHEALWPVPGAKYISSSFGIRKKRLHSGIDIPACVGMPVIAAYPGVVIFAGPSKTGYGKLVVTVDKVSGYIVFYAHLSRVGVHVGDYVSRGEYIGRIGNTGHSYGPHLHFEVRTDLRTPIDPLDFLNVPDDVIIGKR